MTQTITFEHPVNERIRTFLRAEYLFDLAKFRYTNSQSPWDAKDCVATIIEIYNLIERTEFKTELQKEIERHLNSLQRLVHTPTIDKQALNKVFVDLENSAELLKNSAAKQGYFVKEHEILTALRQRLMIPGGTCSFDLPSFHYWLHLSPKSRQFYMSQWLEGLEPLAKALSLVLQLTRQSSFPTRETATNGTYQKTLDTQIPCQLIRLSLRLDNGVYPEISASKHRVNIRFLQANFEHGKPALAAQEIPFELTCCMI